jgi:hypothetical protein
VIHALDRGLAAEACEQLLAIDVHVKSFLSLAALPLCL